MSGSEKSLQTVASLPWQKGAMLASLASVTIAVAVDI